MKRRSQYWTGNRVIVKANRLDGVQEEHGRVLRDVVDIGGNLATTFVEVNEEYRIGVDDDGIREVTLDQIRPESD